MKHLEVEFDASESWGVHKNIDALHHPISEFNTRGGLDLDEYQAVERHLAVEHPTMGAEAWAKIKEELPTFELLEDPNTKQKIRVQKFNWPEDGDVSQETVTCMTMPFSVSLEPDHVQYQHYLSAKELGTPFVVFENPAYGKSDKLTKNQKKDLKNDGDFGANAEPMLGIAAEVLGARKVNLMGYSMGAETSAAMAAHAAEHGIEVEHLFVMEGPRATTHNPFRLLINFSSDANNLKFTWEHPVDPVLRETAKLKPALPKGAFSYGMAMTKGGLVDDLDTALKTQPNMKLIVASAGTSKVSLSVGNNIMVDELKTNNPGRYIRRIIVPGEGHAYGDSGQRFAQLGKLVLR